jgi:hypothetical protein
MDSTVSPKVKTSEGKGVGARSLACSTLGVEGCAGAPGWGRLQKKGKKKVLFPKENDGS